MSPIETGAVPLAPSFGALLKRYRLAAGLTHEALAERASLSARAISDLERGISRVPRHNTMVLLADALELAPEQRAALAAAAEPRPGGHTRAERAEQTRHNLPVPLTSFVGREQEVAEITQLLPGPHLETRVDTQPMRPRLVTLTGVGGCGKTRLALEVAARLARTYPDGVWLADLAPLADETLVPQAALSALGLREVSTRPALETLTDYLRRRDLLLLLDNCEHLVAACARLVETLLRACPGLHILATSRELLGVAGEVAWQVPSLSLPDPQPVATTAALRDDAMVEAVAGAEAVRLIVERARLVQPGFLVTAANAPMLGQLCRRLDGIPLALELAAARLRGLTLEQLVARLDDRFGLLTGGNRTALRRQQTLRAAVDWSYDLLSEDERALLRRLSVFAGGWTLEAAEAVGDDLPDVLGLLLQLVDKSLVLVDGGDAAADGGSAGSEARYRLLETIRQYAAERLLDAGETAAARDRHRDYFLTWAERAAPHVIARDQLTWMARIEAEHDNLRAALDWCQGDGSDRELRLAAALAHFWVLRGYGEEARGRLHGALDRGDPGPSFARAVALDWLGFLAVLHGESGRAKTFCEQAAAVAEACGEDRLVARALRHIAMFSMAVEEGMKGSPQPEKRTVLEQALAAARTAGDRREIGYILSELGVLAFTEGDQPASTQLLSESIDLLRQVGDRDALSSSLRRAGDVALAQGKRTAACALFEEALMASREMGHGIGVHYALTWLGSVALAAGELAAARGYYNESALVAQDRGDRQLGTQSLRAIGGWCVAAGDLAQAARLFGAEAAARGGAQVEGPLSAVAQRYADDVAAARAGLGETAFKAGWAKGAAMTLDEAVAYALSHEAMEVTAVHRA